MPTYLPGTYKEELVRNCRAAFARWRWLLHALIWLAIILFSQVIGDGSFDKPLSVYFLSLLLCTAGFCYTFLLLIVPRSRFRKKLRIIFLGIPVNVIIWWALLFYLRAQYYHLHINNVPEVFRREPGLILGYSLGQMLIMAWGFFAVYYFIDLYDQQKGLNIYQDALSDKLKAELALLQQQINPHFLFNTLNNIYLLVLKQDDASPVVIGRLKSLLQYMLYDCKQDEVPLENEVAFIRNYISLEKLRVREKEATISFDVDGDTNGISIAPLLLINFVENAFKHGVKGGIGHASVAIKLTVAESSLLFEVSNSKQLLQDAGTLTVKSAGGIGNANVVRRLEILYPGKHELSVSDTERSYTARLQLTVTKMIA